MNKQETPSVFGDARYQIVQLLSDSGSACVYKLFDQATKLYRIGKFYAPHKREHFDREKKILQYIKDQHIIKYVDSFVIASHYYLVLSFTVGCTLKPHCIPITHLRKSFLECCQQIFLLQNSDSPIAHNDIKPTNIVYNPQSESTTFIDFGCATFINDSKPKHVACTTKYAPPELYNFMETNFTTDLFSLAKTYLYIFPEIREIDPKFYLILRRCVARQIENRFQNIQQVFFQVQNIRLECTDG